MGLNTAIFLAELIEAITVSIHLLVYSLLRKKALAVLLNVFRIQRIKLHVPFAHQATI